MHLPRPRFRLPSYSSVIATTALFFALTGSAAAVSKYLMSSDPIAAGDLAGSTYGAPVIAAGKVTSAKIADGAITSAKFDSAATAPNAAKLDGHAASAFATIVASGTITINNPAPGECTTPAVTAPAGTDLAKDYVLAQPPAGPTGFSSGLTVTGGLGTVLGDPVVFITVCNEAGLQTSFSRLFKYLVLHAE